MAVIAVIWSFSNQDNSDHVVDGFAAQTNLIYSSIFFVAGGLIYLYREKIKNWNKWIIGAAAVAAVIFYFAVSASVYTLLIMFAIFAIAGISLGGYSKGCISKQGYTLPCQHMYGDLSLPHVCVQSD